MLEPFRIEIPAAQLEDLDVQFGGRGNICRLEALHARSSEDFNKLWGSDGFGGPDHFGRSTAL